MDLGALFSLLFFYVIIVIIGIWASRRFKHSKTQEMIIAGRQLGYYVGIFTMTATWVGGGYVIGAAEIIYTKGLIWCQAPVGYTLSLILAGLLFAKQVRKKNYMTMLDPLQEAFGTCMGGLLYLPALTGEILWCASILAALGTSISVIIGWDNNVAIFVSAMCATAYTLLGGLYSVAYTDIIQCIISFLGLYLVVPFVWRHEAVGTKNPEVVDWVGELTPEFIPIYIDMYLMIIFGGIPWQAYFQRVLACQSPNQARSVTLKSSFGCALFAIPAVLIGIAGKSTDWSKTSYSGTLSGENPQNLVPLAVTYLTPYWVCVLAIGAISAAMMSSADSSILGASSLFSWNIYKITFRPKASDKEIMWVIRISILVIGILAAFVAAYIRTIYGLVYIAADLVYVILFPQLLCVVHVPQLCNIYGSVVAYFVGGALRVLAGEPLLKLQPVIKYPLYSEKNGQLFPFRTFAMLVSLFLLLSVSALVKWCFKTVKIFPESWNILKCDFTGCSIKLPDRDSTEEGVLQMTRRISETIGTDVTYHYVADDGTQTENSHVKYPNGNRKSLAEYEVEHKNGQDASTNLLSSNVNA